MLRPPCASLQSSRGDASVDVGRTRPAPVRPYRAGMSLTLDAPRPRRNPWRKGRFAGPAILAGSLLTVAATFTACGMDSGFGDSSVFVPDAPASFDTPLPIPPLADSTVVDGVRVFSLTAQEGRTEFLDGRPTTTWGFKSLQQVLRRHPLVQARRRPALP